MTDPLPDARAASVGAARKPCAKVCICRVVRPADRGQDPHRGARRREPRRAPARGKAGAEQSGVSPAVCLLDRPIHAPARGPGDGPPSCMAGKRSGQGCGQSCQRGRGLTHLTSESRLAQPTEAMNAKREYLGGNPMPKIVVSTATLKCSEGSTSAPLVASGLGQLEIVFQVAAGVNDHVSGTNIFPFGTCSKTKQPCVPATPFPWMSGATLSLAGFAALREDAELPCIFGGTINVTDPGQHQVNLDELQQQLLNNEVNSPGLLIAAWAKLAEIVGDDTYANRPRVSLPIVWDYGVTSIDVGSVSRCNEFVAGALRHIGIDLRGDADHDPTVDKLADSSRFKGKLGPVKPVSQANVGDVIIWYGNGHAHAGILTNKNGSQNPNDWDATYSGSKHNGGLPRTKRLGEVSNGFDEADGSRNSGFPGAKVTSRSPVQ